MTSSRLPGKGLRMVQGNKLFDYVLETLRNTASVSEIVFATSQDHTDDEIESYASSVGLACVRGSLQNVTERFGTALGYCESEAAFRVNGDSPMISRRLFDQAASAFETTGADIVTNVFPRSYPPGVSVELIRKSAFDRVVMEQSTEDDREHVTRFIYSNPDMFRIHNLESAENFAHCHLAVDTPRDLQVFEGMVKRMTRPHWEYAPKELVMLHHQVSESLDG